jgi:hypothetical protein
MSMTNKDRMRRVLDGGVPDRPPHFELEFQLGKEMFRRDVKAAQERHYGSETAR